MKGLNIKKYFLILAVCAIIAIIAYSSGTNKSSTNAAYRTEMNSSDSARVAKWDINNLDRNGAEMSLSADVQNIENGSGNWFLEIENLSEVAAQIGNGSKITIKLDSEIFGLKTYGQDNSWDFLKDGTKTLTNPIDFIVTIYDCPLTNVLAYNYNQSGVVSRISIADYNKLIAAEKAKCTEVVTEPSTKYVVFNTTTTIMALDHVTEIYGNEIYNYLKQDFDLAAIAASLSDFGIDTNTKKCMRIQWSVNGSSSGSTGTTEVFSIYNKDTGAVLKGDVNLFDYQKYISSLKGEPTYDMQTADGILSIKHSRLDVNQKGYLNNLYYVDDPETTEDESEIKKTGFDLYQHLTYLEYNRFIKEQQEYLQTLGYLECGLTCSIIFNINVEQVD